MGATTDANDWYARLTGVYEVNLLLGLGSFAFTFMSKSAGVVADFAAVGVGVGAGLNVSSAQGQWCRIDSIWTPFSANGLNNSYASMTFATATMLAGGAGVWISATKNGNTLFDAASVGNFNFGVGVSAGTYRGLWCLQSVYSSGGSVALAGPDPADEWGDDYVSDDSWDEYA